MDYCGITDHGSVYGLYKFQELCKKEGIKPILGTEFYFLNGHNENGKPERGHVIALAIDNTGLQNIYKLQELAHVEGFYIKPTITMEMLKKYSDGIICTSACLANIIPKCIMAGEYMNARKYAKQFKDIFGDRFYLEIQDNTLPEQHIVNRELINIGRELSIELVATNDVHYVYREDASIHEVLLAIGTNKKMDDPKRWRFPSNDFWLKSDTDMLNGFKGIDKSVVVRACHNTFKIAERCTASIDAGHYLPTYPFLEAGVTSQQQLATEVNRGYENKLHDAIDTKEYREALQNELEVINRNGYNDYFLIVQDYIKRARNAGLLVGDGRGSGAGSKVCYATNITTVEPSQYNLLFERFIADGREPDIDSDFNDIDSVYEILANQYGVENIARISSFGTLAPRAVTRKVLSIFNLVPGYDINRICKLLPDVPSLTWEDTLNNREYITEMENHPQEWKAIQRLQGNVTHTSMHAGGIIIWDGVSNVLPVKCIPNENGARVKRVTCFDMDDLHDLGHFKFDILGLKTLELQDNCLQNVVNVLNEKINLDAIDYEDKNVLNLMASGDLLGIFQLEEQAQRVKEQNPQNFRDIIAINALIRPGTGKGYFEKRIGTTPWSIHELQKPYIEETYGEYIYQEQYMQDCNIFAGWEMAYVDKHIRKNRDIRADETLKAKFLIDVYTLGLLTIDEAELMWERISVVVEGGYGFNKSHSACYGRIAFKMAHMKYYYPECFYSALLTKYGDDQEKIGEIINECKGKGINILPPSINEGTGTFTPTPDGIRYRLNAIKGVGDSALAEVIKCRPIKSLSDLLMRRNKSQLRGNNIRALIQAGVFDFEDTDRSKIMFQFELHSRTPKQVKLDFQPEVEVYNKAKWEFESLGLFLTAHALDDYAFRPISAFNEGCECLVAGIVTAQRVFQDKRGKTMAFVTISNQYETIKLCIFASTYKPEMEEITQPGCIVYVKGKRQGNDCLLNTIKLIDRF